MSEPRGMKARLTDYLKTLSTGGSPEEKRDHVREGLAALERGDTTAAAMALVAGLVDNPKQFEARKALIKILLQARDFKKAETQACAAVQHDAQNPAVHTLLGEVLHAQRRHGNAESSYRAAIQLNPKFVEAHVRLGILQFEQNYMKEALATLEKAIFLNAKDANARYYIAQICVENEDFKRALIQSHWAEKIDPSFKPIYFLRADIFEHLEDWRNAGAELDKLVDLGETDADIYCRLGQAKLKTKDVDGAQTAFEQALKVQWYCQQAHFHLAQLHEEQSRFELALGKYKLLLESKLYAETARAAIARIEEHLKAIGVSLAGEDEPEPIPDKPVDPFGGLGEVFLAPPGALIDGPKPNAAPPPPPAPLPLAVNPPFQAPAKAPERGTNKPPLAPGPGKPKLADLVGTKPQPKPSKSAPLPKRPPLPPPPAPPPAPAESTPPPIKHADLRNQMLQMQLVMALFMEMQNQPDADSPAEDN